MQPKSGRAKSIIPTLLIWVPTCRFPLWALRPCIFGITGEIVFLSDIKLPTCISPDASMGAQASPTVSSQVSLAVLGGMIYYGSPMGARGVISGKRGSGRNQLTPNCDVTGTQPISCDTPRRARLPRITLIVSHSRIRTSYLRRLHGLAFRGTSEEKAETAVGL